MEPEFKRVLIINNYSMFEPNPLGITLRNIFKDWPCDNLMEVYRYNTSELSESYIKSYKLPAENLPLDRLIRHLAHKEIRQRKSSASFELSLDDKIALGRKVAIAVKYFSETLFVCGRDSELYSELERFKPQAIYTIGESLFTLKASMHFARIFGIPIVLHYMDNWRDTIYPAAGWLRIFHNMLARNIRKAEGMINQGLVISPKMHKEYTLLNPNARYRVLFNPVALDTFSSQPPDTQDDIIVFSYVGGLHLNRWQSLLEVERVVAEVNNSSIAAELYIYCPESDKEKHQKRFDPGVTSFLGYLPNDRIGKAYQRADILIHVESFNEQVVKYTKYSLSTKIPECMAAGKPILCYAPLGLAVSEYIAATGAGLVVENQKDLLAAAYRLADDADLRQYMGQKGIKTIRNFHSNAKVLEVLRETL